MERDKLYLRQRSKQSVYSHRRLLAIFALLALLVFTIVVLSSWRAAFADGPGLPPPSSASASSSPRTQVAPANIYGVYTGCLLLEPVQELPQSSR